MLGFIEVTPAKPPQSSPMLIQIWHVLAVEPAAFGVGSEVHFVTTIDGKNNSLEVKESFAAIKEMIEKAGKPEQIPAIESKIHEDLIRDE